MSAKFVFNEVIPRIPFLVRLAIAHSFGRLETSAKWDLKTTLIVRFVRSLLAKDQPSSISVLQTFSLKDPGIVGQMWVSKVIVPLPSEHDVLDRLLGTVDAMKERDAIYDIPSIEPVEAEWTGFRKDANEKTKHMTDLPESELYDKMMQDTTSDVTVLYMHGGALIMMDPASHRPVCSRLGKITGGRCLSVRYRLAPKFPFPAALLDCLIAYLYLLSPSLGSYHKPVPASNIVFAGDSAGGTLSFALLQLILQMHRSNTSGQTPTIRFNGKDVPLPIPGGVATFSAWVDLTRSMPSTLGNARWDYLPPPSQGTLTTKFPACALWPTKPTREDLYCDVSVLLHPLVSPMAAKSSDWEGSCPVSFLYGEEVFADEGKVLCRRLARAGIPLQWDQYDGMPHCWAMMIRGSESSNKAFKAWGDFIARAAKGERIETKGSLVEAKTLNEKSVDVNSLLGELNDVQVEERMRADVKRKLAYGPARNDEKIQAKL